MGRRAGRPEEVHGVHRVVLAEAERRHPLHDALGITDAVQLVAMRAPAGPEDRQLVAVLDKVGVRVDKLGDSTGKLLVEPLTVT